MNGRLPWIIALLVPATIAVWCFARTLDGGFLSDDFLLASLYAGDAQGGVDWSKVSADFFGPWFGLEAPLYRPLLTTSFAIDITLHGPSPSGYHVANLLFHVVAVCSTAVVAAVLVTPRGQVCVTPTARRLCAAIAAGSFVAVHPVAVESVGWIAARNSGLEVAFRNAALALFALQIARPTRFRIVGAMALAACALATKESAVLLAPSVLAIDCVQRPDATLHQRLRFAAPLLGLVAIYLLWRTILFGTPIGSTGGTEAEAGYLDLATQKAALVFWPESGQLTLPTFGMIGLAVTFLLVVLSLRARPAIATVAGFAWFLAMLAPTHAMRVFPEFGGSRLILDAAHVAATLIAAWLFAPAARKALQIPAIAAISLAILGMAVGPTQQRIAQFEQAWGEIRSAMPPLRALCEEVTDDRPLALVAMPQSSPSVPPLNQNCWFPLTERPFQAFDYPMVSLGYLTVAVPGAESLLGDASAAAALWHAGSEIASWAPATADFNRVPPISKSNSASADLTLTRAADGSFRYPAPAHAMACEAIRLRVAAGREIGAGLLRGLPSPTVEVQVEWLVAATPSNHEPVEVDLTHSLFPSFLASLGIRLEGFTIELRDSAGDAIDPSEVTLTAIARLERIDAPAAPRFFGNVDELDQRVRGPASDRPLRLVLLGPHGAITCPLEPDGTFALTDEQRTLLNVIAGYSRSSRFYPFYETVPEAPGPHLRSDLGPPVVIRPRGS